jgi:UDP-glucose 4-epimerase
LAAESRIQPSILNPIEAVNNNCVGTCAVLQCSREAGVEKVIYSSTSSGYGLNPAPNIETQQDHCINPYSVSKIAGEKLCSMYHSLFGLKTIILRYFNVYGDRSPASGQYAPVVGIFLKQLANKVPLTIVGDGSKKRDFINVLDVAEANVMSAVHFWKESEYGQVYNVGSGKNFSIKEVADSISINQTFLAPREGEVETTLADISKIANTLGWKPHTDLFEWISKKIS